MNEIAQDVQSRLPDEFKSVVTIAAIVTILYYSILIYKECSKDDAIKQTRRPSRFQVGRIRRNVKRQLGKDYDKYGEATVQAILDSAHNNPEKVWSAANGS